jgi:hypothetical protein
VIRRRVCAVLAAIGSLAFAGHALAQLSPGKLSSAHAALEGSTRCLDCHRTGKGVDAKLCLSCHDALGARVGAGLGLHARPGHDACERCHVEHQGRDFELVWWGEQGPGAFDHAETGRALVGAHMQLECRQCHRPERLADPDSLRRGGARLSTTYLGLDAGCAACHRDVHAGRFDGGCETCHDQEQWTPARGFDHDRTRFALRGSHRTARCSDCHHGERSGATAALERTPAGTAGSSSAGLFVGDVPGTSCAGCHRDPHDGRLGGECQQCHRETAWTTVDRGGFDHGRTRFPLVGRHAAVECSACHASGTATAPREFERCQSCHADTHRGQLAGRADGGDCRSCHDESGFAPARFSIEDHARTAYPLEGAHLAVRCDACHLPLEPAAPASASPGSESASATARRYRFATTACASCHATPHQVDVGVASADCSTCHAISEWNVIRFDHGSTRFPLPGAHAALACEVCHDAARLAAWSAKGHSSVVRTFVEAAAPAAAVPLAGLPLTCAGCHRDVHGGQLERAGGDGACERCHRPEYWSPADRFDHDRDSSFPLGGAHRAAPCAGCHRLDPSAGDAIVRYRPLASGCADCHAAAAPPPATAKEGRSRSRGAGP